MEPGRGESSELVQCANAESPPCYSSTKRNKELENVALQSSLNCLRAELRAVAVSGDKEGREPEEGAGAGLLFLQPEPGAPAHALGPQPEPGAGATKRDGEERSLTDHLNKRLLCSFLEKLNEMESPQAAVQRADRAAHGQGDSNRALDEW